MKKELNIFIGKNLMLKVYDKTYFGELTSILPVGDDRLLCLSKCTIYTNYECGAQNHFVFGSPVYLSLGSVEYITLSPKITE